MMVKNYWKIVSNIHVIDTKELDDYIGGVFWVQYDIPPTNKSRRR